MTVRCTIDKTEDFLPNQFQRAAPDRISNTEIGGRKCIRFLLKTTDSFSGTHRCEAIIPGKPGQPYEVKEGSERWIGCGLRIQSAPAGLKWASNKTLMQIRSNPETAQPFFGLLTYDSDGKLGCSGAPEKYLPLYDVWMDVLIRVKHSAKAASEADVWINDKLTFQSRGKVTIGADGGYLKVGAYGSTRPVDFDATVYYSHIVVATTRAEAEATPIPTPTPAKANLVCAVCGTVYTAQLP